MKYLAAIVILINLFPPLGECQTSTNAAYNHLCQKTDSLVKLGNIVADSNANLALTLADSAFSLALRIKYEEGQLEAMFLIGHLYYWKGKYYNSVNSFLNCAILSKKLNDLKNIGKAYEGIGFVLISVKQLDQANYYLSKALNYTIIEKDTLKLIHIYLYFGLIALERNDLKSASRNFLYGFYIAQKAHNSYWSMLAMKQMGSLYLVSNNLQNALLYYQKALSFASDNNFKFELGTIYSHIAHTYKLMGNYQDAISFDCQSAEIRQTMHQKEQYISSLLNICSDYMGIKKYETATSYLTMALSLLTNQNISSLREYAYSLQKDLFLLNRNYKEAFDAFQQYSIARDSVMVEKNRQEVAIIQSKEQLVEVEQRNKILEYQNSVQKLEITNQNRLTVLYAVVIIVILVTFSFLFWLYIKTKRSRAALETLNRQLDREVTERKQAESSLKISESSYRFLAENTLDVIIRLDSRARLIYVSPNCREVLGYTIDEFTEIFRPFTIIHPEYHEAMRGLYQDMIQSGQPTIFTYEAVRKDGSRFWVESLSNPLFDPDTGKFSGSLTVIRDIAERVKYEEQLAESTRQKEILLREIHHRVKNNFAILASVLALQKFSAGNKELESLVNDLQTRIRSMSLVHELLYKNNELDFIPFDIYLLQLTNIVASAFRSKPVHIIPDMAPCTLDIDIALPLGLVVNELITNSFKYAFSEEGDGYLFMDLKMHESDPEGNPLTWKLTIRDNGKGLPEGYSMDATKTLGSQIVKMLVHQVEGSVEATNSEGARFEIIFKQSIE